MTKEKVAPCQHLFDIRLCCDGKIHYFPCVRRGCNERKYFSKHVRHLGDRQWPNR